MKKIYPKEGLRRVIGIPALAISIVNSTIGAGIFILPGIVGMQLGAAGILVYMFCGLIISAVMLCYCELGSRVTRSGGSYTYVLNAFGPLAGFVLNWLVFFGWTMLACAALLNALADSIAVIFPVFSNWTPRTFLFFSLLTIVVLLNIRSAKMSVQLIKLVTALKLVPLIFIVLLGVLHFEPVNLQWEKTPTVRTIGQTALLIFFAFAGFETTLSVSGEIKNPKHTVPAGIMLGGSSVLIIYILIQIVVQGTLGARISAFKNAPLAAIADLTFRPVGGIIILVITAISCFGTVCGDLFNTPRVLFAGAKDGLFPKILADVHPRFATPYLAVITYATLIFLVSISGGFKQLAILASSAILIIYLTVLLAMVKLKMKKQHTVEQGFIVPGGFLVPFIAILGILWMLSHLTDTEIFSTFFFIGVVCVIYFLMAVLPRKAR